MMQLLPTIEILAIRLAKRLPQAAHLSVEDLVQVASLRIWRYLPAYDASRGTLKTWASSHIHGAFGDLLREGYFLSGTRRKRGEEKIVRLDALVRRHKDSGREEPRAPPDDGAAETERLRDAGDGFRDLLKGLNQTERIIFTCYFQEGWTMRRIGVSLGLSESRVSQITSQVLARLKPIAAEKYGFSLPAN